MRSFSTALRCGRCIAQRSRPLPTTDRDLLLLNEAVVAFHTMLVGHPELSARTAGACPRLLLPKGEDDLSRRPLRIWVLASNPPEAVAANVMTLPQPDEGRASAGTSIFGFCTGA